MAKSEKTAAAKSSGGAAAGGQEAAPATNTKFLIAGAVILAALVGGIYWWAASGSTNKGEKGDVAVEELMTPGPLEDISLGKADAPYTIVEYASMTCPHCAQFHKVVLPELQAKYIDTGQARLILREFPLDGLAMAAFMLARCAGPDRYYPMVGALFETQQTWAVPGTDGKEKLRLMAKQAGFSNEKFEQCLADKALFDKIAETRRIAHEKFGVDSTPSFFINGKRLKGEHQLKDFEALMGGDATSGTDGSASQ
ncbi:MAG TPA: DsbA family protein [Methyloceanibacter sp.]|nr:DsbA family protein [Methyloceanibacter sp.]